MPSEHDRETAFLRRCIRYEDSTTGRLLDERIAKVQHDERSMRRASRAMAFTSVLAVVGLGYGALFLDDFPTRMSLFTSELVIKLICALGIGSLICLLGFTVVWFIYRKELNRRREECRRRVTQLLESHLGQRLIGTPSRVTPHGEAPARVALSGQQPTEAQNPL